MLRRKKSLRKRVVGQLKKGFIRFSPAWPPVSISFLVGSEKKRKRSVLFRNRTPLLVTEVVPPGSNFPIVQREPQPMLNPIQREALPMIAQKLEEAKAMGPQDIVLALSFIEYAVRHPKKAQRAFEDMIGLLLLRVQTLPLSAVTKVSNVLSR